MKKCQQRVANSSMNENLINPLALHVPQTLAEMERFFQSPSLVGERKMVAK
jgi:hypothetical protein